MEVKKKVTEEKIVGYECDICGHSCGVEISSHGDENQIFATLRGHWTYGSKYDTEDHECHMCESCYDKVKEFIECLGGEVRVRDYLIWTDQVVREKET